MKNTLRKSNGITLIALVITIIVLLILVGITIAMLVGENGLLNRATGTKDATKKAELIEKVKLDILEKKVAKNGGTLLKDDLKEILDEYFEDVDSLELPDDLSNSDIKLNAKNEYGGIKDISIVDIYSGKLKKLQSGLYDATTGILKKSWAELIEEGTIIVNNGVISTKYTYQASSTHEDLDGDLVIDDSVTGFFFSVFQHCEKLHKVIIPESVTGEIYAATFSFCTTLESIKIPDSITIINDQSFERMYQFEKCRNRQWSD